MPFNSDPSSNQPHKDEPPLQTNLVLQTFQTQYFCARGRIFSAAGRETPVAEITDTHLLLYPPGKPFDEHAFAKRFPFASAKMAYYLMISDIYAELSEPTTMVRNSTAWVKRAGVPESIKFPGLIKMKWHILSTIRIKN